MYLAGSAFGAVQWWSLFSLAEVRVVWMAAPQLFARIKCTELAGQNICERKRKYVSLISHSRCPKVRLLANVSLTS